MLKLDIKFDPGFQKRVTKFVNKFPNLADEVTLKAVVYGKRKIMEASPSKWGNGVMKRSWEYKKESDAVYDLFNDAQSGGKFYAVFLEDGTGIHGPLGKEIKPKTKKYLHFYWARHKRWVRTEKVRGVKAHKMLEKTKPKIAKRLQRLLIVAVRRTWGARF